MSLRMILMDVGEVHRLLRAGDRLSVSAEGWRLVQADVEVDAETVRTLKAGGVILAPLGGRLVPLGDQLPGLPLAMSQTWQWQEDRRRGRR